jgi:NitT/TauT family transport system substrate-binding protein
MKAADVCAREPDRVARTLVEKQWTDREDYARQTLRDLPYGQWREFNPEDTMRFYALRLHEAGLVKASPQKLLAQGTDWRFLTEPKKELKG